MTRNGFTLIELMVVIALMALMAGAVVVTAAPAHDARADAARLAGRLAAARSEAIMTASPVAAWLSASGYGFERRRGGAWEALDDKPFGQADWREGVRLTSLEDGRQRLHFDALGMADAPAFFVFADETEEVSVRVAADGKVSVQ